MFIVLIILTLSAISSCQGTDLRADSRLLSIESIIQEKPAEAYSRLDSLDIDSFTSGKDKALYSLLYSMALDKNYIDVKSDSLIRPAVDYYSRRGDKYHRFLCFYYKGRVEENAEEYDDALQAYIRAEEFMGDKTPAEYKVRLYTAKYRIFFHQFAFDRAIEDCTNAAKISKDLSNPLFYLRNSLDIANLKFLQKKYEESEACLDSLASWLMEKNIQTPYSFYEAELRFKAYTPSSSKQEIDSLFTIYKKSCSEERVPPDNLLIAQVMNMLGRHREALDLLDDPKVYLSGRTDQGASYYSTLSGIYECLGDYKQALDYRYKYEHLVETMSLAVFNNDVRFLQERYENARKEEAARRERAWTVAGLSLLALALALMAVVLVRRERKYKERMEELREEYRLIKGSLDGSGKTDEETEDILKARLTALKPYLERSGIGRRRPSNAAVAKLAAERTKMLESLGLMCALTHPGFVSLLSRNGLTAEEIGFCTLYVADYQPKELPDILGKGSIYHRNAEIRSKLSEFVKDTTLPKWLQRQYRELG